MSQAKVITVTQALELVKDQDEIVTGLGASEGRDFLSQLHTIAPRINKVTVVNCLPRTHFEFQDEQYADKFFVNSWFYSPAMRTMHKNGNASYIPNNLHFAGSKRLAFRKPNIYVGSASKVDEHGYISLSMGNTYEKEIMAAADIVILEVNPNFPRTFGDVQVHVSEVDYLIESTYLPPVIANVEPNELDMKIGKIIADLVHDGDCIQLGIGGIPNAVAKFLYDKKDLGVHTEMLTSEMAKLSKAGVINGSKKQVQKGQLVTTFILGDEELYEFVNDNSSVVVLEGCYVNNPYNIMKNDNQVSINTTLEVDLTGQCASESIGPVQFSGTGGQSDTARGAQYSKNGRSIIALYSSAMIKNKKTGEREKKSKIVAQLTPGAIVSLQRQDTDIVVTEYGVAYLKGASVADRVERLIAIAHPDFREQLYQDALEMGFISRKD